MELRTRLIRPVGALAMASTLALGAVPALAQDDQRSLADAPVDMHEGTCANPTLDPWDEIGRLTQQDYGDVGDDVGFGVDDEGYLTEDLDDDGILDDGEDLNDNDILDAGIDADGDGILVDTELLGEGEALVTVVNLPTIYATEGEIDADYPPLFDQDNVIAVHQSSENYETIVACGNLGGVPYEDQDEIVIGLSAVDGSGIRGYAVFEFDPSIFGNEFTRVSVFVFEGMPTQRDNAMMATPTA